MASTKSVKILERVGDPRSGAIIAPGATVDLPEVWADRYIAQGKAELAAAAKPKAEKSKTKKDADA